MLWVIVISGIFASQTPKGASTFDKLLRAPGGPKEARLSLLMFSGPEPYSLAEHTHQTQKDQRTLSPFNLGIDGCWEAADQLDHAFRRSRSSSEFCQQIGGKRKDIGKEA
jgi:hypothetical protein